MEEEAAALHAEAAADTSSSVAPPAAPHPDAEETLCVLVCFDAQGAHQRAVLPPVRVRGVCEPADADGEAGLLHRSSSRPTRCFQS
jgi:hypothetical protein